VAEPLGASLAWMDERLGSLGLAILALVLLVSAALSQLALKAERDRRTRRLAPRMAAIKARFGADFESRSRATSGITCVRWSIRRRDRAARAVHVLPVVTQRVQDAESFLGSTRSAHPMHCACCRSPWRCSRNVGSH
jgi:hypothetical protein